MESTTTIMSNMPGWWFFGLMQHGYHTFIETGTGNANTTVLAVLVGQEVITTDIEITPLSEQRLAPYLPWVDRYNLDSPTFLADRIANGVPDLSIFWLDAHWCGGAMAGRECPLMEELHQLRGQRSAVILVDDAHMFTQAPPAPHDPKQWPRLGEIRDLVAGWRHRPDVSVSRNIIVIKPRELAWEPT